MDKNKNFTTQSRKNKALARTSTKTQGREKRGKTELIDVAEPYFPYFNNTLDGPRLMCGECAAYTLHPELQGDMKPAIGDILTCSKCGNRYKILTPNPRYGRTTTIRTTV